MIPNVLLCYKVDDKNILSRDVLDKMVASQRREGRVRIVDPRR